MKCLSLSTLLAFALLSPFAVGQRSHGGGWGAGMGNRGPWTGGVTMRPREPGVPGLVDGCRFGGCFGRFGFRNNGYGFWPGYYAPYFADYDGYWTLRDPVPEPPPAEPPASPSVIVVEVPEQKQAPTPVEPPKLIEVTSPTDTQQEAASKPKAIPPTVFILSSGERLQASRYTLTFDSLRLQQGRSVRVVPVSALNLDATVAVNHERGIDLAIPQNRNQITLGF